MSKPVTVGYGREADFQVDGRDASPTIQAAIDSVTPFAVYETGAPKMICVNGEWRIVEPPESLEPPEVTAELPDWVQEGDVLIVDVQRFGEGIVDSFEMRVVLDGDRLRAVDMRPDVVDGVERRRRQW